MSFTWWFLCSTGASQVVLVVKNAPANAGDKRDMGSILGLGRSPPWRSAWQPTPVFLPGESHGWRSLAGYSAWSGTESDTTEATKWACIPRHVFKVYSFCAMWQDSAFSKLNNNPSYVYTIFSLCFVFVQLLSHDRLFASPWAAAQQASLSFTISLSSLKLMSSESVMPSIHLILCCPLSSCLQSFPASGSLSTCDVSAF